MSSEFRFVMQNQMDLIGDGIYVGSSRAEADLDALSTENITRVVSVLTDFQPSHKELEYLVIPELDMPDSNLLQYFDTSYEFIHKAVSEKRHILIHCAAGQSRSTTITAAYLMKARNWAPEEALDYIKQSRPQINPNSGFIKQLHIYQKLNYSVDVNQSNGTLENAHFAQDPILKNKSQNDPKKLSVRCKKCRRILFDETNIIEHIPKSTGSDFNSYRGDLNSEVNSRNHNLAMLSRIGINTSTKGLNHNKNICSSVFMEPMDWIKGSQTTEISDKICCPKCEAKLGQYNWSGSKCSCGTWVTPSFQIHKSRVDFI
ncbi:hypothetical protein BB561_003378 [Smittium simulii]|uniref:protein-tyrosine-phosphatase n=1 Tax=Smittium simulii TaxID=133385 RepID=A0A2T9YLL3_9FUNG|nr:hypothetical protein BB561_003378 [Smittium simulii]